MSYHDIYTVDRKQTGMQFTEKTDYLRDEDEYSINISLFIIFENHVILQKNNDKTFKALDTMLLTGETSVKAVERVVYDNFRVDLNIEYAKIISMKTIKNNIFDIWIYKVNKDTFETMIDTDENFIIFNIDDFSDIIKNEKFIGYIDLSQVNDVFDIKIKSKTKPLIIKSNRY